MQRQGRTTGAETIARIDLCHKEKFDRVESWTSEHYVVHRSLRIIINIIIIRSDSKSSMHAQQQIAPPNFLWSLGNEQ